jgi:SsrA-binding protein
MKVLAKNKKALFNFELLEQFEAGMILKGWEVKSVRRGSVSLKESYVVIKDGKALLIGAHISKWPGAEIPLGDETREKELLLNEHELIKLQTGVRIKGQTIAVIDVHLQKNRIKAAIALVRGKKLYDKRAKLKEQDQKREIERDLKNMVK